jgi:lysophospholipase L1-like esterase
MKPRLWQKVTISLVALLIALAVSELVARAILPAPPNGVRQPQITYLYDPEIRYVMAPSQQGWIDDGFLRINSFGFRGRELTIPKPAGTFRVAVIGDSVTLGWGVADDETFSAQLEALLQHRFPDQGIEIVNLGVGGYDTRQEVTLLRRYVARLEPDLALVGFYSNDVPDSLDDNGGVPPSGTRIAASNPQSGQVLHMNPTPSSGWNQFVRRSRIAYTLGSFVNRVAKRGEWGTSRFSIELDILEGKQTPELNRAWSIVQGQLGELRALAASYGFPVGIVVLPCKEQVLGQYPNAQYQSRVRTIAEPLGMFVIDPLPSLASERRKDELFIPYDRNHPSAVGHRIIAESVFRSLLDQERLSGNLRTAATR